MTHKAYRYLTHALFIFLAILFVLLYLLINFNEKASRTPSAHGWDKLSRNLGTVTVSDVRSGGFILGELPIPASTTLDAEDFDSNVITCRALVKNEGEVTVKVSMDVYGTDLSNGDPPPPALCGSYRYYESAEAAPTEGYRSFLKGHMADFTIYHHDEKNMEIYADQAHYPAVFTLAPGESRQFEFFFWADAVALPYLSDLERDAYSVTVKLTSRAL
ncbi:MAG: hypothetical protein RR281_01425 [Pseudoflavonifractor sp.]